MEPGEETDQHGSPQCKQQFCNNLTTITIRFSEFRRNMGPGLDSETELSLHSVVSASISTGHIGIKVDETFYGGQTQ